MDSSRRDLLYDVAEHRSILKNNQNYPSFTPRTGIKLPKTGVLFLVCSLAYFDASNRFNTAQIRYIFQCDRLFRKELFSMDALCVLRGYNAERYS